MTFLSVSPVSLSLSLVFPSLLPSDCPLRSPTFPSPFRLGLTTLVVDWGVVGSQDQGLGRQFRLPTSTRMNDYALCTKSRTFSVFRSRLLDTYSVLGPSVWTFSPNVLKWVYSPLLRVPRPSYFCVFFTILFSSLILSLYDRIPCLLSSYLTLSSGCIYTVEPHAVYVVRHNHPFLSQDIFTLDLHFSFHNCKFSLYILLRNIVIISFRNKIFKYFFSWLCKQGWDKFRRRANLFDIGFTSVRCLTFFCGDYFLIIGFTHSFDIFSYTFKFFSGFPF